MKQAAAGTILFSPGQNCAGFVILHSGCIKVSLTAENGREMVLYRVRPGEICLQTFGCLIKHVPYATEGVAETDIEIELIPVNHFDERVAQDSEFREKLFEAVASRFVEMEQLIENFALSSLETRLARALLHLCDEQGMVHVTHDNLAVEIGSGRAAVSRMLSQFAERGLIIVSRGNMQLRDRRALSAIISATV